MTLNSLKKEFAGKVKADLHRPTIWNTDEDDSFTIQ